MVSIGRNTNHMNSHGEELTSQRYLDRNLDWESSQSI